VAAQVKALPLVSTIDHHGILNHPFFINSNLLFSQKQGLSHLVCLSTAGVSLNNSSWPACFTLTSRDTLFLKRYSLFPDKRKMQAVLATRAFTRQEAEGLLAKISRDRDIAGADRLRLLELAEDLCFRQDVLAAGDFSSQASLISARLWEKTFPAAPKVVYLPLENLVGDIIISHIAKDPQHALNRLLFTAQGWQLAEKHFQGSLGVFSRGHKGSFLFWGIDGKKRRVHLYRKDAALADGGFSLPLDGESASSALALGRIYPTSLLCFLVLLYYGLTCLGGFNQVNWLADIKTRFLSLLKEAGEEDLALRIARAETANFAEAALAFLPASGRLIKASGLDIFLRQDPGLYGKYGQLAKELSLKESLDALMPEIYRIITPAKERREESCLPGLGEILAEQGLERKILKALS
jgi:hypothetical protein